MYTVALNREAETAGLNDWVGQLRNHTIDGAGIANGFINSKEFLNKNLSNDDFVRVLYATFFDREPDEAGMQDWLNRLNAGVSRTEVLSGFVNSEEFLNRNLCDADYVDVLYQTFLGRPSEIEGKIYWILKLHHGGMTREQVLESFASSQEFSNIMAEYGF